MKNIFKILSGLTLIAILYYACQPLDIKRINIVNTGEVLQDSISFNSAVVQGLVIDLAEKQVEVGHCWNENGMPTVDDNRKSVEEPVYPGSGFFTKIANLQTGKTYYVRAYAMSGNDISYGEEAVFSTLEDPNWSIKIDFPDSNNTSFWPIGKEATISWITDAKGEFKIELFKHESNSFVKIKDIGTTQMHSYTYTLPDDGTIQDGEYYNIKVQNITYPELDVYNFSNAFKATQPSISVNYPTGSDVWLIGRTYMITWSSKDVDYVDIILYKAGVEERKIAEGRLNSQSYEWWVDDFNPPVPGTDYTIAVRYSNYPKFENYSGIFEIAVPVITITSPTQNETIQSGTPYSIQWNSNLPPDEYVKIELYSTDGNLFSTINQRTPNTGTYDWTPSGTGNYLMRISSADFNNPQSIDVAITIN